MSEFSFHIMAGGKKIASFEESCDRDVARDALEECYPKYKWSKSDGDN